MTDIRKRVAEQIGLLILANLELAAQVEELKQANERAQQSETPPGDSAQ
jgi:hypothetical protein